MAGPAERRRAIEAALLDFHRTPGRHTLALRQPALLFASIREVLQLAGERSIDESGPAPAASVVQAARFFVRAALLQPDATHYTLLGLTDTADAAAIKDRYRLMMRLMHPDFAMSPTGAAWPADAATRINQAYEVLSSAGRRRDYDEQLEPKAPPAPPTPMREAAPVSRATVHAAPLRRSEPRRVLRWLATGFGTLGGLALIGMWMATQGERDSLVQRTAPRIAADKLPALPSLFAPAPAASPDLPATAQRPVEDRGLADAIASALPSILRTSASEPPPAPAPAAPVAVAAPEPARAPAPAPESPPAVQAASVAQPAMAAAAVAPAPTQAIAAAPAPIVAVATPASPPPPPPAAAAARAAIPSPTMAEVQPILTQLLEQVETGWGDNLLEPLDRSARRAASAQALARQLDALCDGMRPVKVSRVDFRGETRDGRLIVKGQLELQVRDSSRRQLALQAEFSDRGGSPVLTRLAPL